MKIQNRNEDLFNEPMTRTHLKSFITDRVYDFYVYGSQKDNEYLNYTPTRTT